MLCVVGWHHLAVYVWWFSRVLSQALWTKRSSCCLQTSVCNTQHLYIQNQFCNCCACVFYSYSSHGC